MSKHDCRNCKHSLRHPKMGFWLCQHPSLPCMKLDPKDCAHGIPGANAAMISGREPGLNVRPDAAPCAGYKLWEQISCPECGRAVDKDGSTIDPCHCDECPNYSTNTPDCETCGFFPCDSSC